MCSVAATTVTYEREDIQQWMGETTSITLENHYKPQRVVLDENVLPIVAIT